MFSSILIANRAEIACRVIATCRRLGITAVAVYSDADRHARHVRLADHSARLGPAEPLRSYLSIERVIDAALGAGAEAIHPGYGFLAENPDFATACADAGLGFVGPRPETMRRMASKAEAKQTMIDAGIPVVPGYLGESQGTEVLAEQAGQIGYPVLIKPSAGGGGKGMRVVRTADAFAEALAGARREALSAFGDDHVILERFVSAPRHIEVQIFADHHGRVVHLNERECSIQRRHQKIIEECPSAVLDNRLREEMGRAAVAAANAVSYVNAGTVEFLVDQRAEFYFMEMNTRLQVEHPVTEMTTGFDLVEWQLRVAAGEPLPATQEQISLRGHAIEVRLYAEDPQREFLPSIGPIRRLTLPALGRQVRLDTGFDCGDEINIHYDPMIAKLIVHEKDRGSALGKLQAALRATQLLGPTTNLTLLRAIAKDARFIEGKFDTAYVDTELARLIDYPIPNIAVVGAAVCLQRQHERVTQDGANGGSVWGLRDGWQTVPGPGRAIALVDNRAEEHLLRVRGWDGQYTVACGAKEFAVSLQNASPSQLELVIDGQATRVGIVGHAQQLLVVLPDQSYQFRQVPVYRPGAGSGEDKSHPGSPIPGRVVSLLIRTGDAVVAGQPLLALEGMKMEFTLKASTAGVVSAVHCALGDSVEAEVPLVDIEPG